MSKTIPPRKPSHPARVLLVDDHAAIRQGLARMIDQTDDLTVCGEAEDPDQGLEAIEDLEPDIVVCDLSFEDTPGLEFIKDVAVRWPGLPVLVFSMHDEEVFLDRVLRAGAKGYIMKQASTEQVLSAICQVLAGQIYASEKMCTAMLKAVLEDEEPQPSTPIEKLTDRELEVFELTGRGLTSREIAERLHLSIKTVGTHRAKIKAKLNADTSAAVVQEAIRWVEKADGVAP